MGYGLISHEDPCECLETVGDCPRCGGSIISHFEEKIRLSMKVPAKTIATLRAMGIAVDVGPAIEKFNKWMAEMEPCPYCGWNWGEEEGDVLGFGPECFCYEYGWPRKLPIVVVNVTHGHENERTYVSVGRGSYYGKPDPRRFYEPTGASVNRLVAAVMERGWKQTVYVSERCVMLSFDRPDASLENLEGW